MNALADPFKQLIERRLWPVALLLVVALVAVPFLLKEDAPADAALPAAIASTQGQGSTASIVSLGDEGARDDVRSVLGSRKDPFRPAQVKLIPKDDNSELNAPGASADVGSGVSAGGDVTGGGTSAPDPVTPVQTPDAADPTPAPTPEEPDERTYELNSLKVRFGDTSSGTLSTRIVKRLTALPGNSDPAALYLGLSEDGESAVFLVEAGVEVVGDGRCDPSPANCQTLILQPGETVFLTRGEQQWELDLIEIITRTTTDESEARRARTDVAKGGRRALKRLRASSRFRYSEATGTVRELAPADRGLRSADASATARAGFTSGG